jgi:oligopeptide/dipeptide ABC transporter ATP-binding protein
MIKITSLSKNFQRTKALDEINLTLNEGEVLGLVGESGSGKSTLGRILAGLMPASNGIITSELKPLETQMVFQDAQSALNPRMKARDLVSEAPLYHKIPLNLEELFEKVGLSRDSLDKYPHQFSGGQRTRLNIARALAVKPKFLIADEAVASLDVSIQAQILNLFADLKQQEGLTYLFISHDLSVIGHIADRVAVMYLGRIVEIGLRDEVFNTPAHPYTKALLAEVPVISGVKRVFEPVKGEIPSPLNPPSGCYFHTRCPLVHERCKAEKPVMKALSLSHEAACHLT